MIKNTGGHIQVFFKGKWWTVEYVQPDLCDYRYIEIYLIDGKNEMDYNALPENLKQELYGICHEQAMEDRIE